MRYIAIIPIIINSEKQPQDETVGVKKSSAVFSYGNSEQE